MDKQELSLTLKHNFLFSDLTDQQLSLILSISEVRSFEKGEYIIREGEIAKDIYLIISGQVEVVKEDEDSKESYRISILKQGEPIGEISMIDNSPRSASVCILENAILLAIPINKFRSLTQEKAAYAQICLNVSKHLTQKLRNTNALTVKSLQAELDGKKVRIEMGHFLFKILILLSSWIFLVTLMKKFTQAVKVTSFVSFPLIFALLILCVVHIKNSIYPISCFGLNFNNLKKNLFEGFVFTLPILIGSTIGKWWLINNIIDFKDEPLIQTSCINCDPDIPLLFQVIIPFLYVIITPIQEFIARGTLQSSIKNSLSGSRTTFWSIILSNLCFAAFHSQISSLYAFFAFITGCFWGWLYSRGGSLLSPIISHALVGFWCLNILNLGKIFIKY